MTENPPDPAGRSTDQEAGLSVVGVRPDTGGGSDQVQKARAVAGLLVVVLGDFAIVGAAIAGIVVLGEDVASASSVAILTSAFTAISTMTTAYFSIRAATNTAQSSLAANRSP